jgi:hypothetical protein
MNSVNSDPQPSKVRNKRPDAFLLLLLAASLFLNVYLGWRVKQGPSVPDPDKLSTGMKIDPVPAVGLDGKPSTISFADTNKPTVFYVLTPSCIWCRRNEANIQRIVETKANEFRFIGLSLADSGLKEYIDEHNLKFPVYSGLKEETIQALGLGGTPQTIIVSPEGQILKVWKGAYAENLRPEVEAYFGIQLPGLVSAGK